MVSEDAGPRPSAAKAKAQPEKKNPVARNLVPVGRAVDSEDWQTAERLAKGIGDTPSALLLKARIARARGAYEEAVRLYHGLTDAVPEFETRRVIELADVLALAGRQDEAAAQLTGVLDSAGELPWGERLTIRKKRAEWLLQTGSAEQAVDAYREAIDFVEKPGVHRDVLQLSLGTALIAAGDKEGARAVLLPLAVKSSKASIMKDALEMLARNGMAPVWNARQRLERARVLMERRAWDEAVKTLRPVEESPSRTLRDEGRWLNAQILFKRRRHYKEALEALAPIAKGKGDHADEAGFLRVRALSRLDRDAEAIRAYRAYAAKTKNKARAAEARFLAAKLELYLGRDRQALASLERLVGNGRQPRKTELGGPGIRRDAHFLAGLAAIVVKKPKLAEPHLEMASQGTSHKEVLARNSYWLAVARFSWDKKEGAGRLRAICAEDQTSWYALLSARRLDDAGLKLGPCEPGPLSDVESGGKIPASSVKPLGELSRLAAFFAEAGLYRESAAELRRVEKASAKEATVRDFVSHYTRLEAVHYSIKWASQGLEWPPAPEDVWRAKAAYPTPYLELVKEVEARHGLPEHLIHAIARKESLFDPHALSHVGAMGLMQMMPHTYEANRKRAKLPPLAQGELPGPEHSIKAAGYELAHLLALFSDSLPLAIMAYNAGSGAVSRWLERSGGLPIDLFVEKAGFAQTRNYVRRVYQNLVRYRQLAGRPLPVLLRSASGEGGN